MRPWLEIALLMAGLLCVMCAVTQSIEPAHRGVCALAKSDAEEWIVGGCP